MNTPRTKEVVRMAVGPMREHAIIEHAKNLERETITMHAALTAISEGNGCRECGGEDHADIAKRALEAANAEHSNSPKQST